jgi:hypothetical protein
MRTRPPAKAHLADGGQLVRTEGRVLGCELAQGLAHLRWKPALSCRNWREEARHAVGLEAGRLTVEGALRRVRLTRALSWRVPEAGNGTQQLVGALLGKATEQLQLLPVVGRFHPLASGARHGSHELHDSGAPCYGLATMTASMCQASYGEVSSSCSPIDSLVAQGGESIA